MVQAIILCGGKGERLRPLTESIPKPLVKIKKHPILYYVVKHLEKNGIKDIIVCAGYKAEKIHEYFEQFHKNLNIKVIDSGEVDIISRLQGLKDHLKKDFLVLYGDTLSDVDINQLIKFHHGHSAPVTVTVWPLSTQFGILDVAEDGKVLDYKEKPFLDKWINIGYFYFNQQVLEKLKGFNSFESFLGNLVKEKNIHAFKHKGLHITVNSQKELSEAEDNIEKLEDTLS